MYIVDGQVHVWAPNTPEHPWPVEDPPHLPHKNRPSFSPEELLKEMDAAGVSRAVLVPPSWIGDSNDFALEAARKYPDRFAVMGRMDITAPGSREKIATWRQQPGMLGLRLTFRIKGDATDDWVWAEAEKAGVPIMMVSSKQLPMVERALQRYPKLKMIIDHLAIPRRTKDAEAFAHIDQLLPIAKYPNVAVKASALPSYTTDTYPYKTLHPMIQRLYNAYGARRMFWGTDLTKMPCTYKQAITFFTEELPFIKEADKEWIMGRGICEWIGWKMP